MKRMGFTHTFKAEKLDLTRDYKALREMYYVLLMY